jgi:hypothetical protein
MAIFKVWMQKKYLGFFYSKTVFILVGFELRVSHLQGKALYHLSYSASPAARHLC